MTMTFPTIHRLGPTDIARMRELLGVFGAAFEDLETYTGAQPDDDYLRDLLADETFAAVVAVADGRVVGGATAYELKKFERARSEVYIYDLAVAESFRRQGVATALIDAIRAIAKARGAYVVIIQADYGDDPAVSLYTKLGTREDVLHFDIPVD